MEASFVARQRPQVPCKHPSCNCLFQKRSFMLQHYADVHDSSQARGMLSGPDIEQKQKRLVCEQCGKSFENVSSLVQHREAVHFEQLLAGLVIGTGTHGEIQTAARSDNSTNLGAAAQTMARVACNDCGHTFKSLDSLHQHQWDSLDHTRVSRSRMSNSITRDCSQCALKLQNATELEQHFIDWHCLSEVPRDEETHIWHQIEQRFHLAWRHPNRKLPDIHKIFKVYNMGRRRIAFEQYRKELKHAMVGLRDEENGDLIQKVLANGNELLRFHGTRVKCGLAERSSQPLCSDGDCNLCRILESGFKTNKCRTEHFQRFGRGIYVSATSSKADDYATYQQEYGKNVLLVCRVLAGRVHRSVRNLKHLSSPPDGFQSVQGDPGPVLNYDELVVYDDRAILPAYILLYSGP